MHRLFDGGSLHFVAARAPRNLRGLDKIPAEVLIITAGAVVADDRLETTIIGWTADGTMLVLGHAVHWGSPAEDYCWRDLDALLKSEWTHPHGGKLKVDACCIDSGDGDWTDRVCSFAFPRAGRRVMAIKGMHGNRPSIQVIKGKIKGGGRLWVAGVDVIKTVLMSKLSRGSRRGLSSYAASAAWCGT